MRGSLAILFGYKKTIRFTGLIKQTIPRDHLKVKFQDGIIYPIRTMITSTIALRNEIIAFVIMLRDDICVFFII